MNALRLTLRIDVDLGGGRSLGPDNVRLLEAIRGTGSITRAGKALGLSYRRTRLLADDMNNCFHDAAISAQAGGVHGGVATLTPFGQRLIECYRAIENDAMNATRKHMNDFEAALKALEQQPTIKRSLRRIRR